MKAIKMQEEQILELMRSIITEFDNTLAHRFSETIHASYRDYQLLSKLAQLSQRSSQVKQEDLTQAMHVDKSTISRHVRSCEESGLISRTVNSRSEREKLVKLSSKGRRLVSEGDKLYQLEISNLMQKLNKYDLKQFQINLLSILNSIG